MNTSLTMCTDDDATSEYRQIGYEYVLNNNNPLFVFFLSLCTTRTMHPLPATWLLVVAKPDASGGKDNHYVEWTPLRTLAAPVLAQCDSFSLFSQTLSPFVWFLVSYLVPQTLSHFVWLICLLPMEPV